MHIPFGVFSAAATSGGGGGGSYEHIATVYGSSASTIDLTSIPTTYKHLQVRYTVRNNSNISGYQLYMRANSDSSGNYSSHALYRSSNSVVSSNNQSNVITSLHEIVPGTQEATYVVGAGIIDILDYANTSKYKTFRMFAGVNSSIASSVTNHGLSSGNWRSTSAITSLSFSMPTGTFTSLSRFSLYGIAG